MTKNLKKNLFIRTLKDKNKSLKLKMKYQKDLPWINISRKSFIIYTDFSLPNGLNTKSNFGNKVNTETKANNMAIPENSKINCRNKI